MKSLKMLLVLSLTIVFGYHLNGQSVEAISKISTDSLKPGERLILEINMKAPEGFEVAWPDFQDTLTAGIEILGKSPIEQIPLDKDGNVWMRQELTLTMFDTGYQVVPPVKLSFKPRGDSTLFEASTPQHQVYVIPVQIDTTASFKPFIGPRQEPISFAEILPWIIGGLGLAAIIALIIWFFVYRQRKEKPTPIFQKPVIPPYSKALEELESLRHKKLWQNGKVKAYYSELTEIVRVYIEDQFKVPAVEMTTAEILRGIKPLKINTEATSKLEQTLQIADLVKFAKMQPSALENDLCLENMIVFVKESHANVAIQESSNDEKKEDEL